MRLNASVTPAVVHTRPEVSRLAVEPKGTAELKSTAHADQQIHWRDTYPAPGTPQHLIPRHPMFPRGDANGRIQGRQLHEIAEGVRNGSLTAEEAQRLLQQQENISKATEQALADGKLTREEALRLRLMQAQADLSIHVASNNGARNSGAAWDFTAQHQANQIDQIAIGRTHGNITAGEATGLLDTQEDIADARGDANTFFEKILLYLQQALADRDISFHSLPGDQSKWNWDWNFLPEKPTLPVDIRQRSEARPQVEAPVLRRGLIFG